MFHREMASAASVPVFSSILMQVPLVYTMLKPDHKARIITISAESLIQKNLTAIGVDKIPHVIVGTEGEAEFSQKILNDEPDLDAAKSKDEIVRVAKRMIQQNPEIGAIVLECTKMPPYATAIQEKTGLPVFDIYTLVNYVYHAVVRKSFSGYM